MSMEGRVSARRGLGAARWWLGWWMDTRGAFASLALPGGFALLAALADLRTVPLALAVGLGCGLLWEAGKAGKAAVYGIIGLALLPFLALFFVRLGVLGIGLVVLVLAAGVLIALFGGGLWLLGKLFERDPIEPHYRAHWATDQETRDMVVGEGGRPTGDGVVLAHNGGRIVGMMPGLEGRREMGHLLCCGPNRSGKSLHLMTNLLLWSGSTITLDIKGELYRLTAAQRKALGNELLVLDPSGRGNRYDPFAELGYSDEALSKAANIVMETEKENNKIFAQRAAQGVIAAAKAAMVEGVPTLPYLRAVTREGPMGFVESLARVDDEGVREKLIKFLGGRPEDMSPKDYREDRFLASTWSTMDTRLSPMLSEGVLKMTGGSDFRAADLVERPTSLYLMFGESELDSTQKVFQLIMLSLVSGLIRRGDLDPGEGGCRCSSRWTRQAGLRSRASTTSLARSRAGA